MRIRSGPDTRCKIWNGFLIIKNFFKHCIYKRSKICLFFLKSILKLFHSFTFVALKVLPPSVTRLYFRQVQIWIPIFLPVNLAVYLGGLFNHKCWFRGCSYEPGLARLSGLTQFFLLLWGLKYSEELKLKGIAALSNMKACHQAK